jgi:DedD protein
MGLLSFFKRKDESPAGDAPAAADAVAQARIRARRRLIGATVLLGIGVIGFPLLFETQPRPIPVDIPIEIPRKESAPPLALPSARPPAMPPTPATPAPEPAVAAAPTVPVAPTVPAAPSAPRAVPPVVTERAADQGREVPPPAPSAARNAAAPASAARTAAAAASAGRPAGAPASAAARPTTEAQRAQALLEGRATPKAASEPGSARLVVQVGAYTDADKLRDARQKVEKLGMKTYTQVVEADGAKRTRVRVGPFATREEADKAAARIKAAGLPVAILTL